MFYLYGGKTLLLMSLLSPLLHSQLIWKYSLRMGCSVLSGTYQATSCQNVHQRLFPLYHLTGVQMLGLYAGKDCITKPWRSPEGLHVPTESPSFDEEVPPAVLHDCKMYYLSYHLLYITGLKHTVHLLAKTLRSHILFKAELWCMFVRSYQRKTLLLF